jgi:hypothetical protein
LSRYDRDVPGEDGVQKGNEAPADAPTEFKPIQCFKDNIRRSREYQGQKLTTPWARNYRAFANRHMNGSKYETLRYRNRSKIFKGKTRTAVRKNDATAAASMFSTEDVVSITPERSSDKLQASAAKFLHAALNYRLDRSNKWAGPNWFLTAMGARQDSQITGICVTKQYWEYEEKTVPRAVEIVSQEIVLDDAGMPMTDWMTGQPVMQDVIEEGIVDEVVVARDRLMIVNIPAEHAYMDFSADWRDPIQEGGFFIAAFPTRLDDVEHIIAGQSERNVMGGKAWRSDIDLSQLRAAKTEKERQSASVRRAREQGTDPYETARQGDNNDVIWLYECFYRMAGEDWHWWMLGENTLLSDPIPVEEAYPAHGGDRPYVRGVGALEAHRVYPMAPVESWQQAQQEINDITNLSLDALKMGISPITKIKKGRGVDLKAVQNRGPDASILVSEPDDVTFDRAPAPPSDSVAYVNILSNDFDDLAGVFSQSSVQSNRQLNETVGGMQLLSMNAGALTEYDLRVWVETWAEPCLAQCVKLIRYYESDEIVIAVAGENAGLIENIDMEVEEGLDPEEQSQAEPVEQPVRIGIEEVLGQLDDAQVSVKINVGIGALNSDQRLGKLMGAVKGTLEMMPLLEAEGTTPNASAMAQELWGLSGYKDADRFFTRKKKGEEGPPPEIQKAMLDQKGKAEIAQMNNDTKIQIEQMKAGLDAREISLQEREFEHQQRMDMMDATLKRIEAAMGGITGMAKAQQPAAPNAPQRQI